jgi:O-antigen ligase
VVPVAAWRMRLVARRDMTSMLLTLLAFAAISAAVVGTGNIGKRLSESDPYFVRREAFRSAIQMVQDRPRIGFGLGTWSTAYPGYAVFDPGAIVNQAHNDWMQWAVEGGLPFLAFMLAFAGLLLRPAFRSVWGIGVPVVLLHCLVDYPLQQRPALAALFFAVAGAIAASENLDRSRDSRADAPEID